MTGQRDWLRETSLLNFNEKNIQQLIELRQWRQLDDYERIGAIYHFVKDEVMFGYNKQDDLSASDVLADGYGQCNTKSTLFMALLRVMNIECRLHGFTINKALQKGAIPLLLHWLAPQQIIHSWVEVYYQNRWLNLEGVILDKRYLQSIQQQFSQCEKQFVGYGVATECLQQPDVDWRGESTYIQRVGIDQDFGVYASPDEFYREHGTNLYGIKRWLYQYVFRHYINKHVQRVRQR